MAFAPATGAEAVSLEFPVACTLGDDCFIQQYMDQDAGPGATDFTCGPLTYDGHKGTDVAVPTLRALAADVAVLAAAPGEVIGVRDGMPDIDASAPDAPDLSGRECGNGVRIAHADGWITQYCHLAQGSVQVTPGERVTAGTRLGGIGLSGNTEFPHLHITVERDGAPVDPFAPTASACGGTPEPQLWADPIAYRPGGLVAVGFAAGIPGFEAIVTDPPALTTATPDLPALVIWAHVFGARAGDRLLLEIIGPADRVIREEIDLDRTQARLYRAVGKRRPEAGWPRGRYRGSASLLRAGAVLERQSIALALDGP